MMVASVRKRFVYASIKSEIVGNKSAGVVRLNSILWIISPTKEDRRFIACGYR
jgi:hypothetical protein